MSGRAKFREFCRDHWFDTLLWVLAMVGAGGLVAFFGTLVGLCVEYPLPMGFMAALFFFLGVAWSYMMGIRDWRKEKREKREAEEARKRAEAVAAREREVAARKAEMEAVAVLKGYSVEAKSAACVAFDRGSHSCNVDHRTLLDEESAQMARMMDCEPLPGGSFRYTLKPAVAALIEKHREIIDVVRPHTTEMLADGGLAKNDELSEEAV